MLDFPLALRLPLVPSQKISVRIPLSPDFWLVLFGFSVVQYMHTRLPDAVLDQVV